MNKASIEDIETSQKKLGIIAGSGALPETVVRACQATQRSFFLVSIASEQDRRPWLQDVPHICVNIGAVKKALNAFRSEGISEIVVAGGISRPNLSTLRPDSGGLKLLAKIALVKQRGDDAILRTCLEFFEQEGFTIANVQDIVCELLAAEGASGSVVPEKDALEDIAYGARVAKMIGAYDIGQGVVVENGLIIGVEAVEGTDQLIERSGLHRIEGKGPILVKCKKPGQDTRADLPSIGVQTVMHAHKHGFRGIAVEAGASLILERDTMIAKADSLGMFIFGFRHEHPNKQIPGASEDT